MSVNNCIAVLVCFLLLFGSCSTSHRNGDVRMILLQKDGVSIDLSDSTAHSIFVNWVRNLTLDKVKNGVSFAICTSRESPSSFLGRIDAQKYAFIHFIQSLVVGDMAYYQLVTTVMRRNIKYDWVVLNSWLDSDIHFQKKDIFRALTNVVRWHNARLVTFPQNLNKVLVHLAERYQLMEMIAKEDHLSAARWLFESGYDLSSLPADVLEWLWRRGEFYTIRSVLRLEEVNKTKVLLTLSRIAKPLEGLILFAMDNDLVDDLLSSNSTDLRLVLSVALANSRWNVIVKYVESLSPADYRRPISERLFHSAVSTGNAYLVKKLIQFGAKVDSLSGDGTTPLYKALHSDNRIILDTLLEAGASIHIPKGSNRSLLSMAVIRNSTSIVRKLMAIGARPALRDSDGLTPLHWAIVKDNPKILEMMMRRGARRSFSEEFNGLDLVHYAVTNGTSDTLRTLLDLGICVDCVDSVGNNPLLRAARYNDSSKVLLLVENGGDVNFKGVGGNSPLHVAVSRNSYLMARTLTVLGANVSSSNDDGLPPLYFAVKANNPKMISYLIFKGADIQFHSDTGYSLVHVAAYYGSRNSLTTLLAEGLTVNATDNEGETPMVVAVKRNQPEIISTLYSAGASISDRIKTGDTFLHLAVNCQNIEAINELVKLGLNPEAKNFMGESSLDRAILTNNYRLMKHILIRSQNTGQADKLLNFAASTGNIDSLRGLVDVLIPIPRNRILKEVDSRSGRSALTEAVRADKPTVVRYLVNNGWQTRFTSETGNTLVHMAAINGSNDALHILVNLKLDVESLNRRQETPIWLATKYGNLGTMKLLKEYGADIRVRGKQQWEGGSLLLPAAYSGDRNSVLWLLSNGLAIDDTDLVGMSALHEAARLGHRNVVEALLERGACVDSRDISNFTSLHSAAYNGHTNVVAELLKYGADANPVGVNGMTPLHHAASNGYLDIVKSLLRAGSEKDQQDDKGWAPLHWAAYKGHLSVVKELLSAGANPRLSTVNGSTSAAIASERRHKIIAYVIKEYATNGRIPPENNKK